VFLILSVKEADRDILQFILVNNITNESSELKSEHKLEKLLFKVSQSCSKDHLNELNSPLVNLL